MTVKSWIPPHPSEIKQLRETNGFSQARTAHLCRIGLKTYQKWESGTAKPSQSAWTIYSFELKALQLGFDSLDGLVASIAEKQQ